MKKEMVMEFIKKHKVKLGIGIAALVIASGGIVFATVNTLNTAVEAEAEVVKKDVAVENIEVDYLQYVKGLRDWTVAVGLKDVNFLEGVEWDKEYIKNVKVDDSKVKLDTAGEYEITYSVEVVDKKADDLTIKKTVTVKVISEEEAKVVVEEGQEVVTENGIQNKKEAKASSVNDKGVSASQKVKNGGSKNNGNNTSSSEGTSSGNASTGSSGGSNSSGSNGSGGSSNSKPSGGNSENSGSSGNSGNSGGSGSVDTHKHSYTIPITDTIHHDAVTHQEDQGYYETVTISEAWDETKVVGYKSVCNKCGQDYNGSMNHYNTYGCKSTSYTSNVPITEIIHHDAVTEQQWVENWVTVVDKEAWDETVTVGYKCSCGAKQK